MRISLLRRIELRESLSTLSQQSATVAEFRRCLAVFGDSRTFLRQCGEGLRQHDRPTPKETCASFWYKILVSPL